MANVFLNRTPRDTETAVMLENAFIYDIKDSIAQTDGNKVFINTEENLTRLLPEYNDDMLKWLLWHERYHNELNHPARFQDYMEKIKENRYTFPVTKDEVNIIMDILVHDSLSKMFPELVDLAKKNFAQMRDKNSLGYKFKTRTLESMLDEYAKYKKQQDDKSEKQKDKQEKQDDKDTDDTSEQDDKLKELKGKPKEPKDKDTKTDWSKLKRIKSDEFIPTYRAEEYDEHIKKLKIQKIKLGKLTETINSLVTSQRQRTYAMPSYIQTNNIILKGSKQGKVTLALCFDASGSMGSEMETFKKIISKSIPQALNTPTSWFSGHCKEDIKKRCQYKYDYYKGTFQDFLCTYANNGYDDDGDRTIELCWEYEQQGYTPIGITDGGGQLDWSIDKLKQLKHTILVGQRQHWLDEVKEVNPRIQTICI